MTGHNRTSNSRSRMSCTYCREKKVYCDQRNGRDKPCANCRSRGLDCTYEPVGATTMGVKTPSSPRPWSSAPAQTMNNLPPASRTTTTYSTPYHAPLTSYLDHTASVIYPGQASMLSRPGYGQHQQQIDTNMQRGEATITNTQTHAYVPTRFDTRSHWLSDTSMDQTCHASTPACMYHGSAPTLSDPTLIMPTMEEFYLDWDFPVEDWPISQHP